MTSQSITKITAIWRNAFFADMVTKSIVSYVLLGEVMRHSHKKKMAMKRGAFSIPEKKSNMISV